MWVATFNLLCLLRLYLCRLSIDVHRRGYTRFKILVSRRRNECRRLRCNDVMSFDVFSLYSCLLASRGVKHRKIGGYADRNFLGVLHTKPGRKSFQGSPFTDEVGISNRGNFGLLWNCWFQSRLNVSASLANGFCPGWFKCRGVMDRYFFYRGCGRWLQAYLTKFNLACNGLRLLVHRDRLRIRINSLRVNRR